MIKFRFFLVNTDTRGGLEPDKNVKETLLGSLAKHSKNEDVVHKEIVG